MLGESGESARGVSRRGLRSSGPCSLPTPGRSELNPGHELSMDERPRLDLEWTDRTRTFPSESAGYGVETDLTFSIDHAQYKLVFDA